MDVPIGTMMPFAGEFNQANLKMLENAGWIPCDGRALSESVGGVATEFNPLFGVIKRSFGGGFDENGTQLGDFNVPDCRGRFLRGVSAESDLDPDKRRRDRMREGGNINNRVGSVQNDAIKDHKHNYTFFGHETSRTPPHIPTGDPDSFDPADSITGGVEGENAGGKETRPKNINVNWIIKFRQQL